MSEEKKISANRQKKIETVSQLSDKFGKAKAVVFTNYQGLTHKQLEAFKKAIKPLKAEYLVAKNSLLTLALAEQKIKLSDDKVLQGQTGTLFLYEDVISPLKALAKIIKELNLPSVKFGIMDQKDFVSDEQILKLSTLPSREVLLAQLAQSLKGPVFALHRTLNWNLQKLVLTLNAVLKVKPAAAAAPTTPASDKTPTMPQTPAPTHSEPVTANAPSTPLEPPSIEPSEPETIQAETPEEKAKEIPTPEAVNEELKKEETEDQTKEGPKAPEGGEN